MNEDRCRFCKLYAGSLVALAVAIGAVVTAQFCLGLQKLGGHEHVWRVVLLSALRSIGPAVSGSALLLAFLLWAHPLSSLAITQQLPRLLKRGLLLSAPGLLVAVCLILASSFVTGVTLFDAPAAMFGSAISVVGRMDLAAALLGTLVDVSLVTLLVWRGLVPLQRRGFSLPAKLAIALPVSFVLRSLTGLLLPVIGGK
jgi:hypothetical protein